MRFLPCATAFLVATSIANGIIIRHDRPDARYIALGQGHDEVADLSGATGTLIDKRWILTAAHVGESLSPYTSFARIKGRVYMADRVIIHPDFLKESLKSGRDLCLMHLTEDVVGVTPATPYTGQDEVGKKVLFVGRGDTGTGLTGPTHNDGQKRGAENMLEKANKTSVRFPFDAPGKALDLEGISGPGDSGGPALIKQKGKWYIVGVSSTNGSEPGKTCQYGSLETYARVSTAIQWIRSVMNGPATPSSSQWVKHSPFSGWPSDLLGEICESLTKAYNSGVAEYEEFNQKYRLKGILAAKTPEQRATPFNAYRNQFGDVEILAYATDGDHDVSILTRSKKTGKRVAITVFLAPGQASDKHVFEGWNMAAID